MRDEDRVKLWDAINAYAITCGGDPSRFVYGNTPRQKAVAEIETLARAVAQAAREEAITDACAAIETRAALLYDHARGPYAECVTLIRSRSQGQGGGE